MLRVKLVAIDDSAAALDGAVGGIEQFNRAPANLAAAEILRLPEDYINEIVCWRKIGIAGLPVRGTLEDFGLLSVSMHIEAAANIVEMDTAALAAECDVKFATATGQIAGAAEIAQSAAFEFGLNRRYQIDR